MAQVVVERLPNGTVRVPEWIFLFTDEQFIQWCTRFKLRISSEARAVPDDERAAIFRYMVRQELMD
ncbi:MAG: hypothetical protein KGJ62_07660 [Armatimonadetes bacterium]|nr:hypothetical protein [Armatimonadota bacterium]MDE2207232.1 hypothetical protein [Armatimonadota bacterium]